MYGKLINGALEYAPKDYVQGDNSILINFNSDVALMKRHGYKLINDIKPSYNTETQNLSIESYVESDNEITVNYAIKDMTIDPTAEEKLNTKIEGLEQQQLMIEQALQDLILSTMNLGGEI